MIIAILLHIADFNSVCDSCRRIFITNCFSSTTIIFLFQVLFDIKLSIDPFYSPLLVQFELLLHLYLKTRHGCIPLKLPRIKLTSDTKFCVAFITFNTEDHEHVCFHGLGYVIVRQVDGLKRLALGERPLDLLHVFFEIHSREINIDQIGRAFYHLDQMSQKWLQPFFIHWQTVVTDVEVLYALAIFTDALH